MDSRPLISVVTPCFNEEENVKPLFEAVRLEFSKLGKYRFEHIFIDNCSTDGTVEVLRHLASENPEVGVIVNSRNFGHIRSPFHALRESQGEATILMVADFQDPPGLIPKLIQKWEEGFKKVLLVKNRSEENSRIFFLRKSYYKLVSQLSDIKLVENATGSGLYDRKIIQILRGIHDPYPYFRGLIQDIGFEVAQIEFHQPIRKKGVTKNNFYSLYDMAMLGITNHSKVPLRLAAMIGFVCSLLSALIGMLYFVLKLIYWDRFAAGTTPMLIGLAFVSSVQLFFMGILGEYVGSIQTQVFARPLVFEKERFGFRNRGPLSH